ncbi:cell wall-associated NlpC family hydrolase/cell division protein FtsB [Aeromicrobium sp. SORGH_AS981]|nr:cell wall-associated NlpC family hydrolase/cell division protein FtsB [Aeromicrobium sp. SORGH_AS_0981]
MHRRGMPRTTRTHRTAAAVAVLTVGATLGVVGPAQADRVTPADVEKAFHEAEVANEQANQLEEDVKEARAEIADLDADIADQLAVYERQRKALGASVVQQQLDNPLGPTASLFGSKDPQQFLEGLGAVQALNSTRADAVEAFAATAKELKNRRTLLKERKAELDRDRDRADAKRDEIESRYQEAKTALSRLSAPQQKTLTKSDTTVDFKVEASGRGAAAIQFAMAQLGKPYIYGGVGPDGYDCSGLVMKSFEAAGASLPRVVGPQYQASQPVPISQVQPGDIVFFPDMSHDGIYLGDGKVIHAPRPGKTVEITTLSIGFTMAGRVG